MQILICWGRFRCCRNDREATLNQHGVKMGPRGPPGRIPHARSAPKEAQRGPERVPNGASEKGKDDPEAEGLKKEGAKSSKIGIIKKRPLNVYGRYFLKESVCCCAKKSPKHARGALLRVPRAKVLGFKTILGRHGGQNGPDQDPQEGFQSRIWRGKMVSKIEICFRKV